MNGNFLDTQRMAELRQPAVQSVNHITRCCEIFSITWKTNKSQTCAMPLIMIKKLFWKSVRSQRSSSIMSAFLVDGELITEKRYS